MTYDIRRVEDGRIPVSVAELHLDTCAYAYGQSVTNLLKHSEDFSHADWTKLNAPVITTNVAPAPDGARSMDNVNDDSVTLWEYFQQVIPSFVVTNFYNLSMYLEKDNIPRATRFVIMRLTFSGSTSELNDIKFDTKTGELFVIQPSTNGVYGVVDEGDHWRIFISAKSLDALNTAGIFAFFTAGGASDTWLNSAATIGSANIWGAQITVGIELKHYVKTTTVSATGACTATAAKANLLTYSEEFDRGTYIKVNTTVSADAIAAPNGEVTADSIIVDTATGAHYISRALTKAATAIQYTVSIHFKKGAEDKAMLRVQGSWPNRVDVAVDLTNGTILSTLESTFSLDDHGITALGDDWFRVWATFTTDTHTSVTPVPMFRDGSSYTGNGTDNLYYWGLQIVLGAGKGIYYKTEATAHTGTVGAECYNTYNTCQDTPNYTKHLKVHRFYEPVSNWPAGQVGYPCLVKPPKFTPCKIDPKGSLGKRGVVTIKMADFADDDIYTDPYFLTRSYAAEEQGTFFGKLKFRTPYYKGRFLKMRLGYVNPDGAFDWADFNERLYLIDTIDFDQAGSVTVTGKDILKLADDKRSQSPVSSTGTLSVALTAVATSLVLQVGEGVEYDSSGYVSVGQEVMAYGSVVTDTLILSTRGALGSKADTHDINDTVQQCLNYETKNVIDILYDQLVNFAGVDPQFIPYDGFELPELFSNTSFHTDLVGWTLVGTTAPTWDSTRVILLTQGATDGQANQTVTTVIGETYTFSYEVVSQVGGFAEVILDAVAVKSAITLTGTHQFVATAISHTIGLSHSSASSGMYDNIGLKEEPTVGADEWDVEKSSWLGSNVLSRVVVTPTGVNKLIERICRQNLIYMWFDERTQKIKLRAIAPLLKNETPPTLDDVSHIIHGSISTRDNAKDRISQVWVYYDIIDITEDLEKASNYSKYNIVVDTDSENVNAYDEKAVLVIYADWLSSSNAGLILTLAGRLLSRYAGTPTLTKFKLDTKDADVWTGSSVILDTFSFQAADGSNLIKKVQILKVQDTHEKQVIEVEAEGWDYQLARYGFVAADSMLDYTAESAANQTAYGFISQNDELYTNGDAAHLIA